MELLEQLQTLSIKELDTLIEQLRAIRNRQYNEQYVEICIYPDRKIVSRIESETGYDCNFIPSQGGRGTHVIMVPRSEYTPELEQQLVDKYDDLNLRS